MRRASRALTGLVATAAMLTLTACGAVGPESGGGDRNEADPGFTVAGEITCQNIDSELQAIGDELRSATEQVFDDPESFVSELQQTGDRMRELVDNASDPQLREKLQTVEAELDTLIASVTDGSALNNLSEFTQQAEQLDASMTTVNEYCASQS